MHTDKLTEMIAREWTLSPINAFYPQIKAIRRELLGMSVKKEKNGFPEKRLVEKEIGMLLKARKGFYIYTVSDKEIEPVLGALVSSLREITHETIISCVSRLMTVKPLGSMDIDSIIWQTKFCVLKEAAKDRKNPAAAEIMAGKLAMLTDIDADLLCAELNPLERLYSEDELYGSLALEVKELYRRMTAEIAVATGLDEARLSREYMNRCESSSHSSEQYPIKNVPFLEEENIKEAEENRVFHIGEIIMKDYRRVFPFAKVKRYLWAFLSCGALISVLLTFFTGWWALLLFFMPVLAALKPAADYITIKTVRVTGVVPRLELEGMVPDDAKTLCVISTLLANGGDAEKGLERLRTAQSRNNSKNIKFALLCDLKAADTEKTAADEEILKSAKQVFGGLNDFIILIRKRTYCKTQNAWQGEERKRGAILALSKLLRSGYGQSDNYDNRESGGQRKIAPEKELGFRAVYGDIGALKGIRYLCALDYDTVPLMDSISELVSVALHPLNRNKGIIAPRITTTLSSYLKTGFSRAMSGNVGCAGASSYDSFSGEMYQDCFGEGIFTGKGLINVDIFLARFDVENDVRFPPEKILSHDILEGGCTGVVYAGGIEFSDSFPDTGRAYFKRQHRWLRGDLQNFRYVFDAGFSPLTRWKLADNARRAVTPIFIMLCFVAAVFSGKSLLTLAALLAVVMPFLMGFIPSVIRGRRFANYRRFYSPVLSQTKQLLRQCVMEIMLVPKNALVSADALIRTLWRTLVTKKHLLDWTTSETLTAFKNPKPGFIHMSDAAFLSLLLFIAAGVKGDIFTFILCLLFMSALPVLMYADKTKGETVQKLPQKVERGLLENAGKMWSFYEDWVTAEHNFLPPDNVQYSPVHRVAGRTSPTNIGMYLLSALCACYLGLIDKNELERRVHDTIGTIEKLKKWHGNLINWYDTRSLEVISTFVSSVDSGNFVCSLVALKEGLKNLDCGSILISRVQKMIDDTNLRPFYNKTRNLFSIGYDMETAEISRHNYDLIMSEARILSYYAVAAGQADKRHWRALGRVMGRDGRYAAPVAWTGTMFEYFMPELLLSSKEGSMEYEALRFSMHCQQKRGRETGLPFGISESGYYAFDEALNYQYKAHGVQAVGLKAGLDRERVISPYSSFLSMACDPISSWNNLAKLEKLGACHPKYGFYEAVDFTKHRVGSGHAVVKSHMAHHVGMSIVGAANTLQGGLIQKLFLSDEKMKRAEELLEEKIIAGETVLGSPERQEEEFLRMNATEINKFSLDAVQTNPLSNGVLTVICSDIGMAESSYGKKSVFYRTTDLMRPRGTLYAFVENEHIMPFFNHPSLPPEMREKSEQSVLFMQNSTEYYRNFRNLRLGMQVFLHPNKAAEIRRFAAENDSGVKRQLTLAAYLEPALANFRDISAHPAFMDLFLNITYDEENKLIIASRKERHNDYETVMAAGFTGEEDFTFSFNRENIIARNGGIFSSMEHARERENQTASVPCPCIFIKADIPLDARGKKECELFFCYGESVTEVVHLARELRKEHLKPCEEVISPLVADTIYGRLTRRILPHILYTPLPDEKAVNKNVRDIRALWRFGISGDFPIVIYEFRKNGKAAGLDSAVEMKKALSLCRVDFDLVILYETEAQKQLAEQLKAEIGTELFCIGKNSVETDILNLIQASAVFTLKSDELPLGRERSSETVFLPLKTCENLYSGEDNYFDKDCFVINKPVETPWCHVLSSTQFGSLVSDRALGFSWALNSRENKLTPWENDLRADNRGEMLLIKFSDSAIYDMIDGSRAVFSPNKAEYAGAVKGVTVKTSVRVYKKGMGKALEIEIENNSNKTRTFELAYYVEPVLGVDRGSARFIKPSASGSLRSSAGGSSNGSGTLIFKNPSNNTLSGAMAISAERECEIVTHRNGFWAGEWSGGKIKPACDIIGALIIKIELPPKHKDKIKFILSFTKNTDKPVSTQNALTAQKIPYMAAFAARDGINSGDERLNALYKQWLPWQTIGARMWARTGFYQNSGAYGYRDQLQDCLCAVRLKPQIAERHIYRACCAQFQEGDVLHWWHDLLSVKKGVRTRYSDDLLWLPYVLSEYVKETGNNEILNKSVYFCEGEELKENEHEKYIEVIASGIKATVYDHAKRALDKAFKRGLHGLLLMGCGDWCDGYNNVGRGGKGESVWLSMFYIITAEAFIRLSDIYGETDYSERLRKRAAELRAAIEESAWDGEYYLRAFYDDMSLMGSAQNDRCKIDLLPQAFATLADLPDEKRKLTALLSAEQLCDRHFKLIKLFNPPFSRGQTRQNPGYVMSYPEGVRENGGQYTHAAVWLALAFQKAGVKDTAEELARLLAPFDRGEEYKTEPYYMTADIYTNPEAYGRGGWSIYTGSAGWYFLLLKEIFGNGENESGS